MLDSPISYTQIQAQKYGGGVEPSNYTSYLKAFFCTNSSPFFLILSMIILPISGFLFTLAETNKVCGGDEPIKILLTPLIIWLESNLTPSSNTYISSIENPEYMQILIYPIYPHKFKCQSQEADLFFTVLARLECTQYLVNTTRFLQQGCISYSGYILYNIYIQC